MRRESEPGLPADGAGSFCPAIFHPLAGAIGRVSLMLELGRLQAALGNLVSRFYLTLGPVSYTHLTLPTN